MKRDRWSSFRRRAVRAFNTSEESRDLEVYVSVHETGCVLQCVYIVSSICMLFGERHVFELKTGT